MSVLAHHSITNSSGWSIRVFCSIISRVNTLSLDNMYVIVYSVSWYDEYSNKVNVCSYITVVLKTSCVFISVIPIATF